VASVRALLDRSLARAKVQADLSELEGDYPSPTLLIEGADVTGRNPEMTASCRIDLPTEEQIVAALKRAAMQGVQ
jgi:hypothetical protein